MTTYLDCPCVHTMIIFLSVVHTIHNNPLLWSKMVPLWFTDFSKVYIVYGRDLLFSYFEGKVWPIYPKFDDNKCWVLDHLWSLASSNVFFFPFALSIHPAQQGTLQNHQCNRSQSPNPIGFVIVHSCGPFRWHNWLLLKILPSGDLYVHIYIPVRGLLSSSVCLCLFNSFTLFASVSLR